MKRIKEHHILSAIAIAVLSIAFLHDMEMKASAQGAGGDKITRQRWAVAGYQDPAGGMTPYVNFAAYEWHPGTEAPTRADAGVDTVTGKPIDGWPTNPATGKPILKWPILAEYAGTPSVVWYWNKSFRTSNGSGWGKPARWAYVRLAEEVWNPAMKQFDVPGLSGTPAPVLPPVATSKGGVHIDDVAGQQLIDILKRSFTVNKINQLMEASPYDEPDTGAPDDGPGAPKAGTP